MSRKLFEIVWLRTAQRRVWSEKIERKQKQYLGPKVIVKCHILIHITATLMTSMLLESSIFVLRGRCTYDFQLIFVND